MSRKTLEADWFKKIPLRDDVKVVARVRTKTLMEKQPEDQGAAIPPFRGISRQLYTKAEALKIIPCAATTFDSLVAEKMIYPQPVGSRIYVAAEEIENYYIREQNRYWRKKRGA